MASSLHFDQCSPVTGIGDSAGGIPALQTFFKALPSYTGAAYVVILHLNPEHQSGRARILLLSDIKACPTAANRKISVDPTDDSSSP